MAIKDLYPASRPTLDLNFAGSRIVDPRITFSRSGTGNVAGYFDEKGVMKFAPPNVPRIDFDPVTGECKGLLIEEQRTNLLTYSEQFDNAAWLKLGAAPYNVTILQNTIVSPDGSLTADKLVERPSSVGAVSHSIYKLYTPPAGAVTLSIFAKAGERSIFRLGSYEGAITSTPLSAVFDLAEGTVKQTSGLTTSAYITSVGNGWYRCVASGVSGGNLISWLFNTSVAVESDVYVGDGNSGIYVWGAQLEQGAFPTSYIPTTTAQVTRAADTASMSGANFSSWNNTTGTILAKYKKSGWQHNNIPPSTQLDLAKYIQDYSTAVGGDTIERVMFYPRRLTEVQISALKG